MSERGQQRADGFIRPLGRSELCILKMAAVHCSNVVQAAWLTSENPICEEHVTRAVELIAANTEILQTCIFSTYFRYWFRRIENFIPDFAVVEGEPMDVFNAELYTPLDLVKGPLWRARLVKLPFSESPKNHHQAVFILCAHHVICDGPSAAILLRDILNLINCAAEGTAEKLPFRPLPPVAEMLCRANENCWPTRLKDAAIVSLSLLQNFLPTLYGAIRADPATRRGRMKMRLHVFTEETTGKLLQQCKAAQVTLNCCIVTVTRLAFLKLLQQLNKDCSSSVGMTVECNVNLRRYHSPEDRDIVGLCSGFERQTLLVSESDAVDRESFWAMAKRIQGSQNQALLNEIPAKRLSPLQAVAIPYVARLNRWLTGAGLRNVSLCHINANNMGDLDRQYFSQVNTRHVRVTEYVRSVSFEYAPILSLVMFHTVAGKLSLSVDQCTSVMTDEMAEKLLNYIVSFIGNVADSGRVYWDVTA